MKIRSVIVEDEAAAREALKNYLNKYCPQVEVIGEAQNIKEAVPLLRDRCGRCERRRIQ
jgi:two-component system LytT family response regulator